MPREELWPVRPAPFPELASIVLITHDDNTPSHTLTVDFNDDIDAFTGVPGDYLVIIDGGAADIDSVGFDGGQLTITVLDDLNPNPKTLTILTADNITFVGGKVLNPEQVNTPLTITDP